MNDKQYENVFRFSLFQGNNLIHEIIFTADNFTPISRSSVNIREIIPSLITKFQKTLSKKKYDTTFDVGNIKNEEGEKTRVFYDVYDHRSKIIDSYKEKYEGVELDLCPEYTKQIIGEKVIKGVECKFGLYINDNPIVERLFYVEGYSVISNYSFDLYDCFVDAADQIYEFLKKNDIKNIWDDYDLISRYNLTIHQVRELTKGKRDEMLRKLSY